MARKRMVAAAMLTIVGAGGLAYAADGGNPLLQLVQAVQVIDGNTHAIADQTSVIAKQTTTVVEQNLAIAEQNAALAKASTQLDQKLDAVLQAIGKIEIPPPAPPSAPPSPAQAVWLAPYVNDLGPVLNHRTFATAYLLNTGLVPATYTCNYFDDAGNRLVAHETTRTVAPGAIGNCAPKSITPQVNVGWLLIVSDNPVVATGKNTRMDDGTFTTSENMPFRAIDCSGDQTGIELVCDAVATIQQGK